MMKSFRNFIVLLIICFNLVGCINNAKQEEATIHPSPEVLEESKTLIVYFSATGMTKQIAEKIQQLTQGELFEIVPQIPYTEDDLKYYTDSRADKEQADSSIRPAISNQVENIEQYDTIILGYPIWHGQAPRILNTFLESYNLENKTIIPFCTSGSSSIGSSDTDLHALAPNANWLKGERLTMDTLESWLSTHLLSTTSLSNTIAFNFDTREVTLNSGYTMPINGLGTYSLFDDVCTNSVTSALNSGVRLIDTAHVYGNEESVGIAIRNSNIPREEIFVITKLYPDQFLNADDAIDEALEKLDIEYIDMMLLHHPGKHDVEAYHAMEKAVADGKIKSIGLSNWYIEELQNFLPQVSITPALIQNEIHPYYQENDVIPYIQNLGIVTQGWYPLGGRGHTSELLNDEVIVNIAQSHNKSSAQVILRWNLQKGVVVIPGSSNSEHIQENTELYDFELTDDEMSQINALDRNEKHDWY